MKPVKAMYFTFKHFFMLHMLIALILSLLSQNVLLIFVTVVIMYVVGSLIALFIGGITCGLLKDSKLETGTTYVAIGFALPSLFFWRTDSPNVIGFVYGVYGALWAYVFWQSIRQQKSVKESKEKITSLSHPSTD